MKYSFSLKKHHLLCLNEAYRCLIIVAVAVTAGLIFNAVVLAILLCLIGIICWYIYQAAILATATNTAKSPDNVSGVFYLIWQRQVKKGEKFNRHRQRVSTIAHNYRAIINALPDGLIVTRRDLTIELLNNTAKRYTQLHKKVIGYRLNHLLRAPNFIAFIESNQKKRTLHLNRSNTFFLVRRLFLQGDQQIFLFQNMSQQRNTDMLRRRFIANISHELNTPLTIIKGYVELISQSIQQDAPHSMPIQRIHTQSLRMERLVKDMLSLVSIEHQSAQERKKINMCNVLRSIIDDMRTAFPSRDLHFFCDNNIDLQGNVSHIISMATNLINNAISHTPTTATITVRWYLQHQHGYFDVADNGNGIPAHIIPRLTERFFRGDATHAHHGTGLGLSIVKHVLHNHSATLEITSTVGEGSTFRCVFPPKRLVSGVMKLGISP